MATFKYTTQLPNGLQGLLLNMEGIEPTFQQFFREALDLKDLSQHAISNLTAKHLNLRMTDPKANHNVSLIEAKWRLKSNQVVVFFFITPTYGGQKVLTPSAQEYQGTFYNVVFQFSGVEAFLGDLQAFTALSKNARERAVKAMVWSCPVKLYSNDPSFYFQGNWEDLSKVDGVVFTFPGPTGTGKWHNIHAGSGGLSNPNVRITKHIAQIIQHMYSFIAPITKALKTVDS